MESTCVWNDEEGTIDVLPDCLARRLAATRAFSESRPFAPFEPDPFNPEPFEPFGPFPPAEPDEDFGKDFDGFLDELPPWSFMIFDEPDDEEGFVEPSFPDEFPFQPTPPLFEPQFDFGLNFFERNMVEISPPAMEGETLRLARRLDLLDAMAS